MPSRLKPLLERALEEAAEAKRGERLHEFALDFQRECSRASEGASDERHRRAVAEFCELFGDGEGKR